MRKTRLVARSSEHVEVLCSHCSGPIITPLVKYRTVKRGYGYCSRECSYLAHKKPNHFERRAWFNLNSRCNNPNTPLYHAYGGRGIRVDYQSFEEFLADIGPRPSSKHSVDRINNDGNYAVGNCRWATTAQQASNTRQNVVVEFNGERKTVTEWAYSIGIKPNTLQYRLYRGWPIEKALSRGADT